MAKRKQYWLMKSEPDDFSIDDLERVEREAWTGVRNYQARNTMRDEMQVGDGVLFYHSNAKPSGVAGIAKIASKPYPDPTQFDKKSKYYDDKATKDEPRWVLIDVAFVEKFADVIPLADLKAEPKLDGMMVTKRGMRLSIQPVDAQHFKIVEKMGRSKSRG